MTEPAAADDEPIIEVEDFSFFYGSKQVLFNIGMTFETNRVTALIGPSGCGKSTLLRNINRMNDLVPDVRHQGISALTAPACMTRAWKSSPCASA